MVYGFNMYPLNITVRTKPVYVWTEDPNMMRLFMLQHGIDPKLAHVSMSDMTEEYRRPVQNMGIYELTMWKFGSRDDKTIHDVVTTQDIMNTIVTNVAIDLSGVMTLGAAALRGDIQIFEHIAKLVESLDFVYIKDALTADAGGCDDDYWLEAKADRAKEYPFYESTAVNQDDSFLYERLYDTIYPGKIQAVTLESYVNIFTKIYIIGNSDYDCPQGDEFDV